MKTKFSLNRLLHNDRFILVIALIAAVAVWALVSFGPSNITSREVSAQITVDLTNTIAGYNDLRVIGNDTFSISVTVQGPRSVIFNLTSNDIQIRPDFSTVQGPGEAMLRLTASKGGKATDYEIVDIYPREVTVSCDYWIAKDFSLTPDISAIPLAEGKEFGDVVLDTAAVPNGVVRLEGPRSVVDSIASIVAKAESDVVVDKTQRFSATLLALDAQGAQVDLADCVFLTPSEGTVALTVPVWVRRKVPLTYQLLHVPEGLKSDKLLSLSLDSITLIGEADELDRMATSIADLGTIDFDVLRPQNSEITIPLQIPSTVRVLEGNSVKVTLDIDRYATKTLSYLVKGIDDVVVKNLPQGKSITLPSQLLSDIVLCGPSATLRRITVDDLQVTLDAASNTGTGSVRYNVRIDVPKYSNVWVYYGEGDQAGYKLYGSVE